MTPTSTTPAEWQALLELGYRGVPTDGVEALYIPVGLVIDVPGGTTAITTAGPVRCSTESGCS